MNLDLREDSDTIYFYTGQNKYWQDGQRIERRRDNRLEAENEPSIRKLLAMMFLAASRRRRFCFFGFYRTGGQESGTVAEVNHVNVKI